MRHTVTTNTDRLRARVEDAVTRAGDARRAATVAGLEVLGEELSKKWPRNTGRSWNGFADALRGAGAAKFRREPLRPNRERAEILEAFVKQAETARRRFEHRLAVRDWWYPPGRARRGAGYRKLAGEIRRLERQADAADRELEKVAKAGGNVIVMDDAGILRPWQARRGRATSTVRDRVYGGSGRLYERGGAVLAELRNHEPHAKLHERLHRVLFRAYGKLRGQGLARVGRRYIERLETEGDRALAGNAPLRGAA